MTARRYRAFWTAALCLYAAAGLGDAALHIREEHAAPAGRFAPGHLAVAFAAGLFWPVDLVAQVLLPEG
jgi:hypothetical protein